MWATIITVGLQVLGWFLDRAKVSAEAKQKFFEFAKKAGEDMGSTKLMQYGDQQLQWLKENPWKETT